MSTRVGLAKSVDFIGLGVFFAHIKNRLYTQGVAKISQKENN